MAEFFDLNPVEDVNSAASRYVKEHWGAKFIVPAVVLSVLAVWEVVYFGEPWIACLAALVWIIGGIAWAISIARKEFMRQFARSNGLIYLGEGSLDSMRGKLFERGHSKTISHLVEGAVHGHTVRFFNYDYSIGHGKGRKTYRYWVSEIKFKAEAPDIVIESRSDWDFTNFAGDHQKEMPVEGFFKKYFSVFVPKDFEIETLQLFTPEVMEYLIGRAKMYNFEFVGDRLYIFKMGYVSKMAELQEFFATTNYLVGTLAPRVFRLRWDVAAMKNLNNGI